MGCEGSGSQPGFLMEKEASSWTETLCWEAYHGKTNIRFLQGRPIICAITSDSHHLALLPNSAINDAWDRDTPQSVHTCHLRLFGRLRSSSLIPVITCLPIAFFPPVLEVLYYPPRAVPCFMGSTLSKDSLSGALRQLLCGTKAPNDLKAEIWG